MKYVTKKWLEKNDACVPGMDWYGDRNLTVRELADALIVEEHFSWANWLITHVLDKRDNVRYALFAARLCEHLSTDPRVKQCNDTVQAWLDGKATIEQIEAAESGARSAARTAETAVGSADAAWSAAGSAARAAESAVGSADAAVWSSARAADVAVGSAVGSADAAVWSSARASESARSSEWSAAWKIIIAEGLRIYKEAI